MALTRQDLGQIKKVVTKSVDHAIDKRGLATKSDLKGFATKDDLKGFATKDDLKGFAMKDDLKAFATKNDLHETEARLTGEIRQVSLDVVQTRAALLQRDEAGWKR